MLPIPASKRKPVPEGFKSEWRLHWEKIARDNPHLKTWNAKQKMACDEWVKTHKKRKYQKNIIFK